ncbi:MAG: hypothetical protein A2603_08230 [Bdellovibrionales bacterium RIFOXYD1_FULL_55_31]|nr:MAG: hypothetical protein A2603_08230 [Bdellovibrionales bacterium RIFOXYD1_FULL_55_31]
MWGLTFSIVPSAIGIAVTTPVYSVYWTIYDKSVEEQLLTWQPLFINQSPVYWPVGTQAFSITAPSNDIAAKIIASQSDALLLLSINPNPTAISPTHFVEFSEYCRTNPDKFIDLNTLDSGCGQ